MKSQRVCVLLVLLLLCNSIGCGENKSAKEAAEAQEASRQRLGLPLEITNSIGMKLRLIPAGEFMMGNSKSPQEIKRMFEPGFVPTSLLADEYPQHNVRITKPFFLGTWEVTQAEYERVMGTNPSEFSENGEESEEVKHLDTSRFPVERVSWDDAVEFCRKLSELRLEEEAGRVYRLPTEAEWEYACRAGTTTLFHFGSRANGRLANCSSDKGPYLGRTATVGSYAPNAFGLYDMHGNVWEWCNDWYGEEYYRSSPENDPQGPAGATTRVVRSGRWSGSDYVCRAANRHGFVPSYRSPYVGFRVALVLADEQAKEEQARAKPAEASQGDVSELERPNP